MPENKVLNKLKLKNQSPVCIQNSPDDFSEVLSDFKGKIHSSPKQKYNYVQVFVKNQKDLNTYIPDAVQALESDHFFWICYPKKSSQKYQSDLSRDKGWEILGKFNFEPVTQISIDEDWTALRFRHVDSIKTMKRHYALSEKGKKRISQNK